MMNPSSRFWIDLPKYGVFGRAKNALTKGYGIAKVRRLAKKKRIKQKMKGKRR